MDIMDRTEKTIVVNRTSGMVGYTIPTLRINRVWHKTGDIILVPINELVELTMMPGGRKLLEEYLLVQDKSVVEDVLGVEMQPEYSYSDTEVDFILYEGTDEQFSDCLDYAPAGVIGMLKAKAIKKKPNTTFKLAALNEKLGVNLDVLIRNADTEDLIDEASKISERRSAPVKIEKKAIGSKTKSKYKVVEPKK